MTAIQETVLFLTNNLGNRKYNFVDTLVPLEDYSFLEKVTKVEISVITDLSVVPVLYPISPTTYVNIIDRDRMSAHIVAITPRGCFEISSSYKK